MDNERLITLEEVADRMQVSVPTVRRWIKAGKLPATKPGGGYRVRGRDFEEFVEENTGPKAGASHSLEPTFNDVLEEERCEQEERDGIGSVKGKKIGEARARLERARQDLTDVGTTGEASLFSKVVEDMGRLDEQLAELQRSVEEGQRAHGDDVEGAKSA